MYHNAIRKPLIRILDQLLQALHLLGHPLWDFNPAKVDQVASIDDVRGPLHSLEQYGLYQAPIVLAYLCLLDNFQGS